MHSFGRACSLGLLVLSFVGCGDDSATPTGGSGGSGDDESGGAPGTGGSTDGGAPMGGAGDGGSGIGGMTSDDFEAGGARPVTVHVPEGYDPGEPTPLVILLHGYSATAAVQDAYFGLSDVASAAGMIFAAPDGNEDAQGNQFWNATDVCCDFFGTGVDDSAYLIGLVDEIEARLNVDPSRVYFVGHSNGGFMSYRMACDHADRIAAIVSLAGATFLDEADCGASEPVSVLQIHGTADDTVAYAGGTGVPGAVETVAQWAVFDGCDEAPAPGEPRDIDSGLAGTETTTEAYTLCSSETVAELWTIEGGGHIPSLVPDFSDQVVTWLLAHPK